MTRSRPSGVWTPARAISENVVKRCLTGNAFFVLTLWIFLSIWSANAMVVPCSTVWKALVPDACATVKPFRAASASS